MVSSYSDITIKLRKDIFEDITEHPTFTLGSGTGWHQQLEMWEIKKYVSSSLPDGIIATLDINCNIGHVTFPLWCSDY